MGDAVKSAIGRLYKVHEAAELLGISTRHLRDLINEGEIIVVRMGDGSRADRVEEIELQRFIIRRRINRGFTGEIKCQSTRVAKSGGSNFKSTASQLDSLLGPRRKPKR